VIATATNRARLASASRAVTSRILFALKRAFWRLLLARHHSSARLVARYTPRLQLSPCALSGMVRLRILVLEFHEAYVEHAERCIPPIMYKVALIRDNDWGRLQGSIRFAPRRKSVATMETRAHKADSTATSSRRGICSPDGAIQPEEREAGDPMLWSSRSIYRGSSTPRYLRPNRNA